MSNLTMNDEAYNACVRALNHNERELEYALKVRNAAWSACEKLIPCGRHGYGLISQRRIKVEPRRRRFAGGFTGMRTTELLSSLRSPGASTG